MNGRALRSSGHCDHERQKRHQVLHLVRFGITNIPKDPSTVRYNDLSTPKIVGDTVGDRVGLSFVYQKVRSWFMIPTESLHQEAHARGGVGFLHEDRDIR